MLAWGIHLIPDNYSEKAVSIHSKTLTAEQIHLDKPGTQRK